jgi:hypothetical protein
MSNRLSNLLNRFLPSFSEENTQNLDQEISNLIREFSTPTPIRRPTPTTFPTIPNIRNRNITVKGNVVEQSGQYFGYIYINDGQSQPRVKSIPPTTNLSTLNATMQSVVNDNLIQSILKE